MQIKRPFNCCARLLLPLLCLVLGCSTALNRNASSQNSPTIKVRLLINEDRVAIVASTPPVYHTDSDRAPHGLNLPKNDPVIVELRNRYWTMNGTSLGQGILTIHPATEGSVSVSLVGGQPRAYRGDYLFVPVSDNKFDVVNQVDIDGYLAGVLARELLRSWNIETYKAQAIVARTYALYEKATHDPSRHWDVFADERSQVYGGIADETDKSIRAVNDTMGIVVTYSPTGRDPRIFKAYFSSCCGGVTQSVADAFGEPAIDPLREQNNQGICSAAPRFNWGPVVIGKPELTRRIRAWGTYKNRAEKNIDTVADISIYSVNPFNRPAYFVIKDGKGGRYMLHSEEFRQACDWDAKNDKNQPAPVLYSSFVKVIVEPDDVRFVEGHGNGHGVGFCQWCSQRRAEEGMPHEDIVLAAYPHAKLMRAY